MTEALLKADPARMRLSETGIPVRAQVGMPETGVRWESVDIAHLDRASLLQWLRSREGLAENVLLVLLGHERSM